MSRLLFPLFVAACSSPAPLAIDAAAPSIDAAAPDVPTIAPELAIMYRTRDGMAVDATAGAQVPLTIPPQGGLVLFVGARVRNLDAASVTVTASLRDAADSPVLTLEQRPVHLTIGADGWAAPADPAGMFDWANLPACPLSSATRDVYDQPYVLRIGVADASGASTDAKLEIVPTCEAGANGDLCRCQCKLGYSLGDPCP